MSDKVTTRLKSKVKPENIDKKVSAKRILLKQSVYLLFGDDTFRCRLEFKRLKEQLLNTWTTQVKSDEISIYEVSSKDDLQSCLFGASLFHSRKLVIINLADIESDALIDLLERETIPDFIKVILYQNGKLDKRQKLYKSLESLAEQIIEVEQFSIWKTADIVNWTELQANNLGIKINLIAIEKLVDFIGNNSALIYSELQKLACYSAGQSIKSEDIEILCKSENDIFDLVDYLLFAKLATLSKKIKEISLIQHPLELIRGMQTIFRNFTQMKSLQVRGMQAAEIAKIVGKHPWKTGQDLIKLSKINLQWLLQINQMLGRIESEIKAGETFDPTIHFRFRSLALIQYSRS